LFDYETGELAANLDIVDETVVSTVGAPHIRIIREGTNRFFARIEFDTPVDITGKSKLAMMWGTDLLWTTHEYLGANPRIEIFFSDGKKIGLFNSENQWHLQQYNEKKFDFVTDNEPGDWSADFEETSKIVTAIDILLWTDAPNIAYIMSLYFE